MTDSTTLVLVPRPDPRRLRSILCAANGVLAAFVVFAAVRAIGSPSIPMPTPAPVRSENIDAVATTSDGVAKRATPSVSLEDLLRLVGRFAPSAPVTGVPENGEAPDAVRPPLTSWRVAMLVGSDRGEPTVVLACLDPAHPERACVGVGRPDGEIRLRAARRSDVDWILEIERGEERREFRVPHGRSRATRSAHIVDSTSPRAAVPRAPSASDLSSPISPRTPGVKGVPYFRDGRLVGLRVTGVRPNGWASDLGVREGDVIEAIDDAPFTDLRETTARLSRGPHPNRLVVLGDEGGSMRRVALAGR